MLTLAATADGEHPELAQARAFLQEQLLQAPESTQETKACMPAPSFSLHCSSPLP